MALATNESTRWLGSFHRRSVDRMVWRPNMDTCRTFRLHNSPLWSLDFCEKPLVLGTSCCAGNGVIANSKHWPFLVSRSCLLDPLRNTHWMGSPCPARDLLLTLPMGWPTFRSSHQHKYNSDQHSSAKLRVCTTRNHRTSE